MANIFERIQRIADRFDEITVQMAEPEIVADFARLNELARAYPDLNTEDGHGADGHV